MTDSDDATKLVPAAINARKVFLAGSALWLIGLAVLGTLAAFGREVPSQYPWICLAGLGFGAIGYWWAHRVHLIDSRGMSESPTE